MPTIPLPQLRPGMVLAADVESPDGRYTIAAGLALTKADLRLMRGWHVRQADILDPHPPTSQEGPVDHGHADATAQEAVRARFTHLPLTDPIPAALLALALDRADSYVPAGLTPPPAARNHAPAEIPSAETILATDPVLVSLPEVFMRIREVVSDPTSTVEEVTVVIGKDPSLTAKLLKLVNSAFYARTLRVSGGTPPGRVDTLSRAVMLLGLNQLSTLAMGVSVLPLFKDIPEAYLNMRQFWRHSVAVGLLTKLLAVRMCDPSPERFFVAGLLHDIGRLVLFKQVPTLAAAALAEAAADGRLLLDVERELFGFDHAELGGRLLRKWRFPESLEQAVWRHHDPMSGEAPLESALVGVADMIAGALLPGCSGERLVPRYLPEAWQAVGLSIPELAELVETAEAHFEVVCAMFA